MLLIPIENVIIKGRIRETYESLSLTKLADDILQFGLYHPVLLEEDKRTLIAGERRLRAVRLIHKQGLSFWHSGLRIPPGQIPYNIITNLTETDKKEVELNENLLRADLTWQEKAKAVFDLHELRKTQGRPTSAKALAGELLGHEASPNEATNLIRNSLLLGNQLEDERIRNAPNEKEAIRILRKKQEDILRGSLSELYKGTEKDSRYTLLEGDMRGFIKTLPNSKFDCIICDPPYGIGAQGFSTMALGDHNYDDSSESFEELLTALAVNTTRICKEKAHAYIFCDWSHFNWLKRLFRNCGWNPWETPLIWAKGEGYGMLPAPETGPRRTYELILYLVRGKKTVEHRGVGDVIPIRGVYAPEHAAMKPAELYKNLLSRSCCPGDSILDPFCGSGPIFKAAKDLNLYATGIEQEEKALAMCRILLEELV